jgi:hypothetical protein
MKVARHEIPGKRDEETRLVGYVMISTNDAAATFDFFLRQTR